MGNDYRRKGSIFLVFLLLLKYCSASLHKQVERAEKEKNAGNAKFKEGNYGSLKLQVFSRNFRFASHACGPNAAEAKSLYEAGLKYTKSLFKVQVMVEVLEFWLTQS